MVGMSFVRKALKILGWAGFHVGGLVLAGVLGVGAINEVGQTLQCNGEDLLDDVRRIAAGFGKAADPRRGPVGAALRQYVPAGAVPEQLREKYRFWSASLETGVETKLYQAVKALLVPGETRAEGRAVVDKCRHQSVAAQFGIAGRKAHGDLYQSVAMAEDALAGGEDVSAGGSIYRNIVVHYKPSAAYRKWEADHMYQALATLQRDRRLLDNFNRWVMPRDYRSAAQAREQYNLRLEALQRVADTMRAAFGLSSQKVYIDALPSNMPVKGFYIGDPCSQEPFVRKGFIFVNYADAWGALDTPRNVIDTMAEEVKHSIDAAFAAAFKEGRLRPDHIAYEHAAMIALNERRYLSSHNYRLFGMTFWATGYEDYENQYIEATAKQYRQPYTERLLKSIADYHKKGARTPAVVPAV